MKGKVIIEETETGFDIYNEGGQALSVDFDDYNCALIYANDFNWEVVESFNIKK